MPHRGRRPESRASRCGGTGRSGTRPAASPRASKPGPRLALEAGTRRVNHRLESGCIFAQCHGADSDTKRRGSQDESRGAEASKPGRSSGSPGCPFPWSWRPCRSCPCTCRSSSGFRRGRFLSSSSVIFLSLNSFFTASLPSRRMLRTATRWCSATPCSFLTSSLRRSSVSGGIGRRMILPSLAGIEAQIAGADHLLDQSDLGDVPRLDRDQSRFGDVQVGNLIERRGRPVIVHAKVVQDA